MKKIKSIILFSTVFAAAGISCAAVNASASYADTIGVSLEQQENTEGDKIRFISTMTPVTDLTSITKINLNFTLSKAGEATKNASITTTSVYDEVTGTNGKNKASNTYYSVYTLTDLAEYQGWKLGTTFEYFYADSTTETTNTVYYDIPEKFSLTLGSGAFEESSSIADCFTASSIEDGNIFHAWNWHMSVIEENLQNIKNAGYTAVQTSPMQPQKDYHEGNTAKDAWWKLYQPLGFVIAPDTCQNSIGTKSDLQSMVTKAHNIGLKVIVDVVANHLAGSTTELALGVSDYEPTIYGTNGTIAGGAKLHIETSNDALDSSHTTNGAIGLPDLNTHDSHVQQRVLSLLKEYIDLGVDGFRFDAAKHIETDNSSEPCGPSQFWPTVVGGAREYAEGKGQEIYCYGEILNGCGNGRSYDWYIPYMDVIANECGNNLRENFNGGTASASSSYTPTSYESGENCIVWAESHDTYANDQHESPNTSISNINKTYAIMGSRNGAKALYLARPTDTCGTSAWMSCQTKLGAKGSDAYKLAEVAAVNKFRNYWGTQQEYLANNSNFAQVVRYNDTESGMVLVNASSGTSVSSVSVPDVMKNGTYQDLVSGNTFTVTGGKVSGEMAPCGIAVLYSGGYGSLSIEDDIEDSFYTATTTATYTIKNAVSATLEVDGKTYNITSGATLTFGNSMAEMDTLPVTIKALDINGTETTKTFVYTKTKAPNVYTVTLTKPEGWENTIYAYMYGSKDKNATWPGKAMTQDGDTYSITYTSFEDYENIIFSDGTYQSEELKLDYTNASYKAQAVTATHFKNSAGWSNVHAYVWNNTTYDKVAEWPGIAMSKDSTGLYAVAYNVGYDRIIFNNGNTQNIVQTAELVYNEYISTYDFCNSKYIYYYNIVKNTCSSHSFDSGVVTAQPTCEVTGVKTYTCANCGSTYTESIPALGHDYDYASEPTWTWIGFSQATASFTCKRNVSHKDTVNATITSSVVGTTTTYTASVTVGGHTYTNQKVDDGSHTHTYTHVEAKAATCGVTGNLEYYYCADCNIYFDASYHETTLEALTIPKTNNHTFDEGVVTPPTRIQDGSVTYTCIACEKEKTLTIDKLGTSRVYLTNSQGWTDVFAYIFESGSGVVEIWPGIKMTYLKNNDMGQGIYYIDYNVTQNSYIVFNSGNGSQTIDIPVDITTTNAYYISDANSEGKYTVGTWSYYDVPASNLDNHNWDLGVITKAPTCTLPGHKTYTCLDDLCDETKVEILPPKGHTWDSGVVTKEPTESTTGMMIYTCTACSETKLEAIPTLSHTHNPSTPTYTWSEDCLSCEAEITCTICNKVIEYESIACDVTVTKESTCKVHGTKVFTTRGFVNTNFTEQTKTVEMPYTDHQKVVTIETLDTTKYYVVTCSVCEIELERKVLGEASSSESQHSHTWVQGTVVAPTRTTNGSVKYTCSDCNETKTLTIDKIGTTRVYFTNNYCWSTVYAYIYNSGTDQLNAWPGMKMSLYGKNSNNEDVYYIDYDVSAYTYIVFNNTTGTQTVDITVDKTTTNAYYISGGSGTSCTVGTWMQYEIPAPCVNHVWDDGVITVAPTEASTGIKTYTCTICGETKTIVLPKLGHTHTLATDYSFSTTTHWMECVDCHERINEIDHEFEFINENDNYYQLCNVCGYLEAITINGLKLHYHRADNDYSTFDTIHVWADGLEGAQYKMTSTDSYGIYYTFTQAEILGADNFGVIIKKETDWSKDGTNKYFKLSDLKKEADGYLHVYFVGGSSGVYSSIAETVGANISYFNFYQDQEDNQFYMNFGLASPSINWKILKNGTEFIHSGSSSSNLTSNTPTYVAYKFGSTMPNVNDIYHLEVTFANGKGSAKGNMMYLYSTSRFEATYGFDGELGAIYSKSSTTFKVWSPISTSMKLRIYETGTPSYLGGNDAYTEYDMTLGTKGVWSKTVTGDLSGKYYTYVVSNFMYDSQELVDPYAKSAGVNGLRGMVVDFESVNPEGWDSIQTLDINPGDLAVYEAHIADLTSSSTWGGNPLLSKTYLGFCEEGTTYTQDGTTVTTGFDHIKELGVNAVQLLPIFDSANDEVNPSFNWGYNPLNYNVLDGSYSRNPYDGYERIREFKTLVMKYNQAGITIIMDVVFNHVSDAMTSNFNYLMPGYYFRYVKGYMADGSGCGNETCSERIMMRKFMIDSTEFWAKEYKLGGFRFDLMGIHDIETMDALAYNLQTNVKSNIVVYGEPWAAAYIDYAGAPLCSLSNYGSWEHFGCFNSTIRDAVLGSVSNSNTWGWVNGSSDHGSDIYAIQNGVMGFIGDDRSNNIPYTVSYVSCHDNYNIADGLATNNITGQNAAKMSTLANALVLTSQGISFIQEGEEFLRDKDGEHNSYNSGYAVNDLDYSLKITYNNMFQNYKKLCQLKTSGNITLPASSCSSVRNSMTYDQTNLSYFYYDIETSNGTYRIIHHNGYDSTATVDLSGYTLYLDTLGKYSSVSGNTTIYPYQTIIAYKAN